VENEGWQNGPEGTERLQRASDGQAGSYRFVGLISLYKRACVAATL